MKTEASKSSKLLMKALRLSRASDETVFLGPKANAPKGGVRGRQPYPSERQLLLAGIKPIRYIAGTESEIRGEGSSSKEGNIYEVLYLSLIHI